MVMKVAVTGAGGYIGRHVVSALADLGADVIAVDLRPEGIDERATALQYDCLADNPGAYDDLGRPDVCVHLAWRNGFVHNAPTHMEDLSGHARFIRQLLEGGLPRLSVMGTMHEIGFYEGEVDETTPCNPRSMYGIAKDALRRYTLLAADTQGIPCQWLRAYYIYGDDSRNNSIFAKLLQADAEGKKTFPFTTGRNEYDFIHVRDLGRQIACAAMQADETGIINCCSGKPVSLAEQVEGFIRDHGLAIKLEYGAFPDRQYDSRGIWGNAERIRGILDGFEG